MLTQKLVLALVEDTGFTAAQVQRVVTLLESGNTIPFLARYRKEETGGLDERGLRAIESAWGRLSQLEARREEIREALMGQGVLTPDLTRLLDAARTQSALEDVYLPYRPKRRTRAGIARERGLETLAELFTQATRERPLDAARRFVGKVPEIDTPSGAAPNIWTHLSNKCATGWANYSSNRVKEHSLVMQACGCLAVSSDWSSFGRCCDGLRAVM